MVNRLAVFVLAFGIVTSPLASKELVVPISAVAQGANNTLFRTDVRIFNPSQENALIVTAEFLPANQNNAGGTSRTITIPPGEMLVFNNIVGDFFGRSGLGAIRFESDGELKVTSRTFTDSPNAAAPGTFGQFIPAVEQSGAMKSGVLLHLSNDTNLSQGFRANTGFMNPGTEAVTVAVTVRSANGTQLGTGNIGPIPPRSVTQVSVGASIGNNISFTDGYMTFSASTPVIGFASVVDNRSSDQIFIAAQQLPDAGNEQPPAAKEVIVEVGPDNSFNPRNVTINMGDTVIWTFVSAFAHTSTSDNAARETPYSNHVEEWNSGTKTSGTFRHTFQTAGVNPYHCGIHSFPGANFMNGVITVRNAAGTGGATSGDEGEEASSTGPLPAEAGRHRRTHHE